MSLQLKMRGHQVGRRKTRRYMIEMGIDPIYPKMNLSGSFVVYEVANSGSNTHGSSESP